MERVRIAIIDANNTSHMGFLDNGARDALHYYDDILHTYLTGSAYTFECKVEKDHPDAQYIQAGNKLSFIYDQKPYNLTIMQTHEEERFIELTAYGCCFELLNETAPAYTAATAKTFVEYLEIFLSETNFVQIGINEMPTKALKLEWTGETDSLLKRIYSLADNFDAEVEIVPTLNADYTLSTIVLNIYQEHSDTQQGIGEDRSDITLRYGVNVTTVKRDVDVTELYTAILPTGKDGLNLQTYAAQTVYDEDGNVLYTKPASDTKIYAPQARDRYPSNVVSESDRYILYRWDTEYSTQATLYGNALAKLKEISVPKATYEVEGYAELDIGDTVIIYDDQFQPALYLSARVTEQEISFTDASRNKTTFDNFREMTSQLSTELLVRVQELSEQIAQTMAVAVVQAEVQYYVSTSANELVGGEWSAETPLIQPGMYAWTRTKFTQANGDVYYSEPSIFAEATEIGNGASIKTTVYYLATDQSSGVTTSTQGWTTATQDISATYPYLWTYTKTATPRCSVGNPTTVAVSDTVAVDEFSLSISPEWGLSYGSTIWPPGSKRNKLEPTNTATGTYYGVTYSYTNYSQYGAGQITAVRSSTSNYDSSFTWLSGGYSKLGAGVYVLNGAPTSGTAQGFFGIILTTSANHTYTDFGASPYGTVFELSGSETIQSIVLSVSKNAAVGTGGVFKPMIRQYSESDFSWERFENGRTIYDSISSVAIADNGTTVGTISWSSVVSSIPGGILEAINGKLAVNRGKITITKNSASLEWGQTADGFNYVRVPVSNGVQNDPTILCTFYYAVTAAAETGVRYDNGYIYLYDPRFTSLSDAKECMGGYYHYVDYALSIPTLYNITETPISMTAGSHTFMTTASNAKIAQEIVYYDTDTDSVPIIIGRYGSDGQTGPAGANGKMLHATSSSSASTAAKTATLTEDFTLEAGATIAVTFTDANSASSPTLNVKNTGAKAIRTNGVAYAYWEAGGTVIFTYDGTYWQVCSSPVYANTATIGNPAAGNVYVDSNSVDIREGSTVLSTFTQNEIGFYLTALAYGTLAKIRFYDDNTQLVSQDSYLGYFRNNADNLVLHATQLLLEGSTTISGYRITLAPDVATTEPDQTAAALDQIEISCGTDGYKTLGTLLNRGGDGKPLYGTCSTTASTAAKVVTCSDVTTLYAGLTIMVNFSTANSATGEISLNVNNTGAVPVYAEGAITGSSNYFLWAANVSIIFVYDGTGWYAQGYGKSFWGSSSTAAGTRAKASSIPGFVCAKGTRVSVRFANGNTYTAGTVRLNVSTTGAIDIYLNSATVAGDSPYLWDSGTTQTFVFSGSRWEIDDPYILQKALAGGGTSITVTPKTETLTIASGSNTASLDLGEAASGIYRFSNGARISSGAVSVMSNIQDNRYLRVATSSNRTSNTTVTFNYMEVALS